MDYKRFEKLIEGGEKAAVDFKYDCQAFATNLIGPKAELAKDICAMANNGNVSYLIIGVKDDRSHFQAVANRKLNDENVQSFCKTAVSPPPKIKVEWRCWTKGRSDLVNKDFVIIQIGPHERRAYSLGSDFIAYDEHVCYRRHDVWIRRGQTTDLATLEEVAHLVAGEPALQDEQTLVLREERKRFSQLSESQRIDELTREVGPAVEKAGYSLLPEEESFKQRAISGRGIPYPTYWKIDGDQVLLMSMVKIYPSLLENDLWQLRSFDTFGPMILADSEVPKTTIEYLGKHPIAVRRIAVLVTLKTVRPELLSKVFRSVNRSAVGISYYGMLHTSPQETIERAKAGYTILATQELLIVDGVKSVPDLTLRLSEALTNMEIDSMPVRDHMFAPRLCPSQPLDTE